MKLFWIAALPQQLRSLIKATDCSLPACVNLISPRNVISSWLQFLISLITFQLPVSGGIRMLFLMPPETGKFFESAAQLPV